MRGLALCLVISLGLAGPALADEAAAPDVSAVIQAQIDAFLADDLDTAFTYASPGIRRMFRTPERFGEMVQRGYPMVWRPDTVRYLDRREHPGGGVIQRVMITDQEGRLHVLDYLMLPGDAGWNIGGVELLRAPSAGA